MTRCARRWAGFAFLGGWLAVAVVRAAEPIVLDPAQQRLLNVTTAMAQAAATVRIDGLLGEVTLPIASSTAVAAPWAGRVVRVLADEGDQVAREQVLAWVESPDLAAARAEWRTARVERDLAASRAERDAALLAEGIIPAARAEASAAELAAREATLQGLAATLGALTQAERDAARYPLRAPLDAVVVERRTAAGEPLGAFEVAFMLLADEGLRLDVQVPAALAALAERGTPVRVAGVPEGHEARVSGRGARVDPDTQTVTVRATLAPGSGLLPGQRISAALALPAPPGAVVVPRASLVRGSDTSVVYRVEAGSDANRFVALPVALHGESAEGAVVSAAGLRAGDAVVVSGTSALRALDR